MKRKDYITWDQLFIGIAELASKRSKDPRTQHGVCIVNSDNKVISVGYNGMPKGIEDTDEIWTRENKDKYVIHAEINSILNATSDLKGSTLYLYSERGYYPCTNGCAQAIIQAGIKEVVLQHVGDDESTRIEYDGSGTIAMFNMAGINIRILT